MDRDSTGLLLLLQSSISASRHDSSTHLAARTINWHESLRANKMPGARQEGSLGALGLIHKSLLAVEMSNPSGDGG